MKAMHNINIQPLKLDQFTNLSADDKTNESKLSSEAEIQSLHVGDNPLSQDNGDGVIKTFRKNPTVILLTLYANIGVLMAGYDNLALALALSMVPFQLQFGKATVLPSGTTYIIPAYWQSLWGAVPQLATGLGAFSVSILSERFGRRISFFIAGIISMAGISVLYTCSTPATFLVGKMINSFALGIAICTGQTYISEIAPLKIRGILLSIYSLGTNLGVLFAASASFSRIKIPDASAYKILFAIGWIFAGMLTLPAWFIPESPFFYARKGELKRSRDAFSRCFGKDANLDALVQDAVRIIQKDVDLDTQQGSYLECFRSSNWKRTRLVLYCNGINQMIGSTFVLNGPYFLVLAGMTPSRVGLVIQLTSALNCVSQLVGYIFVGKFDRRPVVFFGLATCSLLFLVMGIAGCFPASGKALWGVGITINLVGVLGFPLVYGPIQAIAAEIPELRLKSYSQSIGFLWNNIFSAIWNVAVPYMYTPDQGDLGGKVGFIFLFTSVLSLIILYYELPETKDISYEVLDHLFRREVPARKFKLRAGIGSSIM